jgi:hypothetical protein
VASPSLKKQADPEDVTHKDLRSRGRKHCVEVSTPPALNEWRLKYAMDWYNLKLINTNSISY